MKAFLAERLRPESTGESAMRAMRIESRSKRRPFLPLFLGGALAALQPSLLSGSASDPAQRARRVLEELQSDHEEERSGKTYQLTQEELNAYLAEQLALRRQPPVQSVRVVLDEDSFRTTLKIDADRLQPDDRGIGGTLFEFLFRGPQELELTGSLRTEAGIGTYRLQEVRLNGLAVPVSLVEELLDFLGESQGLPFHPGQPFQMPLGIQSLEFSRGRVTIET